MSKPSSVPEVQIPSRSWGPDSWQHYRVVQQPTYPDEKALRKVLAQLATLPPLVTSWEVNSLRKQLADAAAGERFLLQGGDCAERFTECRPDIISNRLKVLLQMSLVMVHGLQMPVIRLGRMAGQYAKPRSASMESRDGVELPVYRGDLVNSPEFTREARVADPMLMLRGHARSAMTLNFVRGLIDGGFADVHHPEYWDLSWAKDSPLAEEYRRMVENIRESVNFFETLAGRRVGNLSRIDFFTSHEALHLHYEQAQTRTVPRQIGYYNLATHFPWIGMRTAAADSAHVEYARGLRNPIGIKIGPGMTSEWLIKLLDVLHPDNEPGRMTLIHRFGAAAIEEHLPGLIEAVKKTGKTVLWVCDPMHGNTEKTANGYKTRKFDNIVAEVNQAFDIHAVCGSHLGGLHLELTGENVTECTGGARRLTETDLERAYHTSVDPRLNHEQALEISMLVVRKQSEVVARQRHARKIEQERIRFAKDLNVHDLPDIFHYWSNRYVLPLFQAFGTSGPDDFIRKFLDQQCVAKVDAQFVSIGSGNADTEIALARQLQASGHDRFTLVCTDINEAMLERGRQAAAQNGVSQRMRFERMDFNHWRPEQTYDAVVANQCLHHVVELEDLFESIKHALSSNGYFLASDMIGRNGHMRWPEALEIVERFWDELPANYKFNHQFQRQMDRFENFDCSSEGFEGVLAQDILSLLVERFHFEAFIAYGNVIDPFVDRGFGHNFDAHSEVDRGIIDRIQGADQVALESGRIKPTHMAAAMTLDGAGAGRYLGCMSPEFCIRR